MMAYFYRISALLVLLAYSTGVTAQNNERRIEEVIVTAEKRESTVSDTSISITAFGEGLIEDLGIQGADELVNFIPATTRDSYDIRIRGVGRNFRALGGDPGVATYYNGIYSEDFGIAASESGLYDVERIEVLRGPQGTLYGRNSIGGALNYITNKPTETFEAEVRGLVGNLGTKEMYGVLSGPIVTDRLAARLVAVKRDRDGATDGMAGSAPIDSIDDANYALSLKWQIRDNMDLDFRWNDRSSDRVIGQATVAAEGAIDDRANRNISNYARGLRSVAAGTDGAITFTHPISGASAYGAFNRPGVDPSPTHLPNAGYGATGLRVAHNLDNINAAVATNDDNSEKFDHNAIQTSFNWDLNDTTSLKYLGGWMDFDYTFDIDLDFTNGTFAQPRQTVLEAVETSSHELQLLWQIGEKLEMTSGLYYFQSDRLQNFAFRDLHSQGRYTDAVNYGNVLPFVTGTLANPLINGSTTPAQRGQSQVGANLFGPWGGNATGAYYEYWNTVDTSAKAAYTQGTYTFNESFALTIGLRWAEDEKTAFEDRTAYFSANPSSGPFAFLGPLLDGACDGAFGTDCSALGLTPLAIANVFAGNAAPTFNPANPIAPTCELTDPTCTTPLFLNGIPFSFADKATDTRTWGDTSFRINLDWTPNEDTLMYYSVTTGYRAGGYSLGILNSRATNDAGEIKPLSYDQEEVMALEVGYKGTLQDGKLQLNASAYYYDYENYQDRISVFSAPTGTSLDQVQNAESATNKGLEVEILWLASNSLTIGGNGSYTKTEYTSDLFLLEDDNPAYPTAVFADTNGDDGFMVKNLNGNALKRIPEWKAAIWGNYEWTLNNGSLTAGGSWSYTGEYYSSGIKRDLDLVPSRTRLDLSLTWRDIEERWEVRGFVDNVMDTTNVREFGTPTASADWQLRALTLYPRFFGLDITYKMGG